MASASRKNGKQTPESITRLSVEGFKSIYDEQSIDVHPLTILAGPNSSGKSSIIQPLLLLKQTLEASYDPGALLLDGPNLKFTKAEQLLSKKAKGKETGRFSVKIELDNMYGNAYVRTVFTKERDGGFTVSETAYGLDKEILLLHSDGSLSHSPFLTTIRAGLKSSGLHSRIVSVRVRCFLKIAAQFGSGRGASVRRVMTGFGGVHDIETHILDVLHVPGLRGNPLRTYPISAVGAMFPGTFENYVASIINHWQVSKEKDILESVFHDLKLLGLTWKVLARPINDTQVEIQVGRLPQRAQGGARDLVSIADVGFGVSQTLPVVVALHAARPGQLVYLEQPEIHLHPRAQTAMAEVLARAAQRGVKVVVETHSSLLLLGVQTLVAQGKLSPDLVKLHWFQRNPNDGATTVSSADLDEDGSFGPWPVDFADVTLDAQGRYLDAVESNHGI